MANVTPLKINAGQKEQFQTGDTLALTFGGTGQTTANASFNALAPSQTSNSGKYLTTDGINTSWATISGSGTVTTVSIATANGVSGSVANATTTPAITLTLGAITPTTVNGITITGSGTFALSTFTLTVAATGTAVVGTGANTRIATWNGTNTITSSSAFTFTGTTLTNTTSTNADVITLTQNNGSGAAGRAMVKSSNGTTLVSLNHYGTTYTTANLLVAGLSSIESTSTVGLLHNIGSGGTYWWCVNSTTTATMTLTSTTFTVTANTVIGSGKTFTLGNAAVTGLVAGAVAALTTATLVLYDSTGQAYRVPCVI